MARLLIILTACLLGGPVAAQTPAENYQAALMQEKGAGDPAAAIALYEDILQQYADGEAEESLAARAKLRLGVCREKLGQTQARQVYEEILEEFPNQADVILASRRHLQAMDQHQARLDGEMIPPKAQLSERELAEVMTQVERAQEEAMARLEQVQQEVLAKAEKIEYEMQRRLGQKNVHLQSALEDLQAKGQQMIQYGHFWGGEQSFAEYAYTAPRMPYPYEVVGAVPTTWKFRLQPGSLDLHLNKDFAATDFDDSEWQSIQIGQAWEDQGLDRYDDGAWYRTRFTVAADKERPVLMAFGGVDLHGFVFVNGRFAGEHHIWDRSFLLDISDQVERQGENTVAIYVHDGMGMGGIYGLVNVHQPKGEADTDRLAVNRGGSVDNRDNDWPTSYGGFSQQQQYGRYARSQPLIPYPYKAVAQVPRSWKFELDERRGQTYLYDERSGAEFDDSGWGQIDIGQAWEDQGYAGYDRGAWYRTQIEIDATDGRPIHMAFGGVDKDAYVYVNGQFVGQHQVWNRPFIMDISKAANYHGTNTVVVQVYDGMGMGGIYGEIDIHQPSGQGDWRHLLANGNGVLIRGLPNYDRSWGQKFSLGRLLNPFDDRGDQYRQFNGAKPDIPYAYRLVGQIPLAWKFKLVEGRIRLQEQEELAQPQYDDGQWQEIEIGQAWEDQGYAGYDEGAWYRARVEIDAETGKPLYLAFGGVDRDAWIYVNGELVGEHHMWDRPFLVDISRAANYQGENTIAVRVYDGADMGGIYGTVNIHQPKGPAPLASRPQ
ncbi:MAG: tetratricopeptide repeat protein [Candidatus Latescibacteria bacterium]|nr:tetratricopeptide repeat protein [Candidatus Latescibacterota bacterium]